MMRKTKPTTTNPRASLRALLAPGAWLPLSALVAAVPPAKGARARVHAALSALRAEGVGLEERVTAMGVEVRLRVAAPLPAPRTDDTLDAEDREAARGAIEDVSQADLDADLRLCPGGCGELGGECSCAKRPKPPGPSSRCAVCGVTYRVHGTDNARPPGAGGSHPFEPRKGGRPRVAKPTIPQEQPNASSDTQSGRPQDSNRLPSRPVGSQDVAIEPGMPGEVPRAEQGAGPVASSAPRADGDGPVSTAAVSEPHPFEQALRSAYPEAFAPEIIDGSDVAETAALVDLSIAFSPVLARRDSLDPCDVTPLEDGRYRLDVCWPQTGLPIETDAAGLRIMRARYLLLRGLLIRSLASMDPRDKANVVRRFFRGVEPWTPPAGSPLASMGAGPLTIAVPEGTGIEGIDWTALMVGLSTPGGAVPAVVPLRALGPEPAPVPWEPPTAHLCEGEHSKACGRGQVNDPSSVDPSALPAWFRLCRACWAWVRERGGGRVKGTPREYVGDRYV